MSLASSSGILGSAAHSIGFEGQAVAFIALAVYGPEIGDLAIGGDAEAAQRVPGVADAIADEGERERGEYCGNGGKNVEQAIVAHAVSFRAGGKEKPRHC